MTQISTEYNFPRDVVTSVSIFPLNVTLAFESYSQKLDLKNILSVCESPCGTQIKAGDYSKFTACRVSLYKDKNNKNYFSEQHMLAFEY